MSDPRHTSGVLEDLLRHRLVVVTGKGGTGKTTVAAALGLAAARQGRRVLLVETGGARRLAPALGQEPAPYRLQDVAPGLQVLSMTPEAALEEFVVRQVRVKALYRMVFRNRVVGPFMDTVPGLPDIIQLGKVWDLLQETEGRRPRWDLVVLDSPATGHGLTMLASPAVLMELTGGGPFHANARKVADLFMDPAMTAVLLTSLPERLPVNETLDLFRGLGTYRRQVRACVLNQVRGAPFPGVADWAGVRGALPLDDPAWAEAARLTDTRVARALLEEEARGRLVEGLDRPVVELPYRPGGPQGRAHLLELGQALAGGAP